MRENQNSPKTRIEKCWRAGKWSKVNPNIVSATNHEQCQLCKCTAFSLHKFEWNQESIYHFILYTVMKNHILPLGPVALICVFSFRETLVFELDTLPCGRFCNSVTLAHQWPSLYGALFQTRSRSLANWSHGGHTITNLIKQSECLPALHGQQFPFLLWVYKISQDFLMQH